MCSNFDSEHDGSILMEKFENPAGIGKWCRKCTDRTQAKVVLRKKDAYCRQCFLSSVTHKFRACLGKSKTMKPGDKVLIGFSGSDNAVALLHLVQAGLKDSSHKKLMFQPIIVFVDESTVVNISAVDRKRINDKVKEFLQVYEYPLHTVPLELSLDAVESLDEFLTTGSYLADNEVLSNLFRALPDVNSRMDMLNKLRYRLLVRIAKSLCCNKVFTADTANDLAVKLFTNVSLGRGAQLPYDVGFSDVRVPGIRVMRPLQDLSKKEVVFYNVFHELQSIHVPSILTKVDTNSSIHKLTETFLCNLQDEFPSTLSTVFRVADKLTTNSEDNNICPLCKAPQDTDGSSSSSLSATQFSRLVSSCGPSNFDADNLKESNLDSKCCGGNDNKPCGSSTSCSKKTPQTELQEILCYGCNLILKNADMETLPRHIMKLLRESNQRCKMKKEIEEYLL